jgi:Kef-type K+ transport system membrane component KefB
MKKEDVEIIDQRKKKKKPTLALFVFSRVFFLLLGVAVLFWLLKSLLAFVFSLLSYVFTGFRNKVILTTMMRAGRDIVRAHLTFFGCLLALFSPKLGIAMILAFFVAGFASARNSPFKQYVHVNLKNFSHIF